MNARPPILVAGIGNIFFGDDAFGSEVARELMRRPFFAGVKVQDFGIRSYDLAYALMDGADAILIDTVSRGEAPGTLYLIEPEIGEAESGEEEVPDGHSLTPASVLRMVRSLGGKTGRIYLVGCEPSVMGSEDGELGLSAAVQAAISPAIEMIEALVHDLVSQHENKTPPGSLAKTKER